MTAGSAASHAEPSPGPAPGLPGEGEKAVGGLVASAVRRIVPPAVVLVVITVGLEIVARSGSVPTYLIPMPSRVAVDLLQNELNLWPALGDTATSALIGFVLSAVAGVVIAVVLCSSRWVQRAFYPYAVFFQTVPIIAIAPLLVIWLGYGRPTVIASALIVSIFPVIANTLGGLLGTETGLRDLFRLYGAGPVATMLKLRLPAALPSILIGLRVAGGLAVIGAIVGEFIGGGGLGTTIEVALRRQKVDIVFATVLLASLLGLGLFGLINGISAVLLRHWHPSEN